MNRRIYFQLTRSWIYQASPFTSFDGLFFFEVGCTKICPASFDNLEGPAVDHWSGDRARFSRCPIRMSRFDLLSDIEKFLLSAIVLIILKKRLRFVFVWLVFCSFLFLLFFPSSFNRRNQHSFRKEQTFKSMKHSWHLSVRQVKTDIRAGSWLWAYWHRKQVIVISRGLPWTYGKQTIIA